MGIFDGLNLDQASTDPWAVPDGTYEFNVTECSVGPTKKGDKFGIMFKFEMISGSEAGKNYTEWLEIPKPENVSPEAIRSRSFLRQRLESLGIPSTKFNDFEAADAVGIVGFITLATGKKGSQFIKNLSLNAPAEGVTSPGAVVTGNGNIFG
jgi:hypothetical protein